MLAANVPYIISTERALRPRNSSFFRLGLDITLRRSLMADVFRRIAPELFRFIMQLWPVAGRKEIVLLPRDVSVN